MRVIENRFCSFTNSINCIRNIKGIIIEYNGIRKYDLFPKELKNELNFGLELNLDIINKKSLEKHKKIYKSIDKSLYRDSITYIFGTINKSKKGKCCCQ